MLNGRRFILWGLTRLSVRVAQAMTAGRAQVTVVRLKGEEEALLPLLGPSVQTLEARAEAPGETLRAAGLGEAGALLALSESDLSNLHAAVAARDAAPHVPVVLRAFDPLLADQLEQGWNVRRAYSVSALAAPAFVAAACGDTVLETLRLGDGEVPICRLTVRQGSPLAGWSAAEVKSRLGCAVLARSTNGEEWEAVAGEAARLPLTSGEQVVIGGPRESVLRTVTRNAGWRKTHRQFWKRAPKTASPKHATRLLPTAAALGVVLLASIFVFRHALHLSGVDALYFVVTTATTTGYGDISLKDTPDWLKLFGCLVMLAGGALLGILFSYLAALATAERLDETMSRRAGRLNGHVIVAGLGNLGYRVTRHLIDLGLDVAVLDLAPRSRFAETLRERAPVLAGDASLPDNLERVAVTSAVAFIACTNDDLSNIQACLYARRLNPQITTVARVFDDALAEQLTQAFAIDRALSASGAAVSAFVGAATDELALRSLPLGGLTFLVGRCQTTQPLTSEMLTEWRTAGVRQLAFRVKDGPLLAASELAPPHPIGTELILCGPAEAVRAIIGG
jgi:Trk K+ transport system NAD-binding subunit